MYNERVFSEAIESLPASMKNRLDSLDTKIKKRAREVRIRAGRPMMIELGREKYSMPGRISSVELSECFRALCGYSVHSHTEEIRQGFLTLKGGHRAGICGTAVYQSGELYNLRDISSVNIRIAREIIGTSRTLFSLLGDDPGGLLLVGEPSSGKTTLLRDCVRKLPGVVSLIDTRNEIAAVLNGVPQKDVGNADVFSGFSRCDGMLCALRTMAPDYIVCDELGGHEDIKAVSACVGGGVHLISTVHSSGLEELLKRDEVKQILKTGAFKTLVFLKGKSSPCEISEIFKAGDDCAYGGSDISYDMSDFHRIFSVIDTCEKEERTDSAYTNDRVVFHRDKIPRA